MQFTIGPLKVNGKVAPNGWLAVFGFSYGKRLTRNQRRIVVFDISTSPIDVIDVRWQSDHHYHMDQLIPAFSDVTGVKRLQGTGLVCKRTNHLLLICQASRNASSLVLLETRPIFSTILNDMASAIASMGAYLAHGASGVVERQENVVIKRPYPDNHSSLQELEIEARIYQHLGFHPRVVPFLSWDHEQSILRTEYMKNGNLKSFVNSDRCSTEEKIRWIKQAADAIQFLHTRGVIHCDVKPDNFLLDENLDLKVCDFAGSSLQGSRALVCSSTRFWRPTLPKTPCDAQDDIFGLGSTIYMILTGKEPFGDLESDEVEMRFSAAEFPDTVGLLFDDVMQACWRGRASIEEVRGLIETGTRKMQKLD